MVEPVRSRNPDLQPVEFIRELRSVTEELGIPLLFDEMVTGFRCHPGGAQAYYGVRADLATYGKVVGGGYPIGVVAGQGALHGRARRRHVALRRRLHSGSGHDVVRRHVRPPPRRDGRGFRHI